MCKKATSYILMMLLFFGSALAQNTVTPQILNAGGGSNNDPTSYYRYEWSIGEATTIQTLSSSALIVTAGVLQPNTSTPGANNTSGQWAVNELKVFPNPVVTELEVDVLTNQKGKLNMMLYDEGGKLVATKTVDYYGLGQISKFNIAAYSAGNYIIYVTLDPLPGSAGKKGSFKIVKLSN